MKFLKIPALIVLICVIAIGHSQDSATAYYHQALQKMRKRDTSGARLDFNRSIQLNPTDSAYIQIAKLASSTNDAINDLLAAVKINPTSYSAYRDLGKVYYKNGNYLKSIECFSKCIELRPNHEGGYNLRGNAFKATGQHQKALDDFRKGIELEPDNEYLYSFRGNYYFALDSFESAKKDFDSAIRLDSVFVSHYIARAKSNLALGDTVGACKDFLKSQKLGTSSKVRDLIQIYCR